MYKTTHRKEGKSNMNNGDTEKYTVGSMYEHIIPAANELDLRVTVIAGTVLADWE